MTAEKEIVIEGPFTFKLKDGTKKVRIGIAVPPLQVIFMDKCIQQGYFPNRSYFITLAVQYYLDYLRKEIDIETMLKTDAQSFYEMMWEEKEE